MDLRHYGSGICNRLDLFPGSASPDGEQRAADGHPVTRVGILEAQFLLHHPPLALPLSTSSTA